MSSARLLQRVLNPRMTEHGVTWSHICKSGLENPDSKIGIYAGDEESYSLFWDKFKPIVVDYHYNNSTSEYGQFNCQHLPSCFHTPPFVHLPDVLTTRIRLARNLKGWAFPSSMTLEQRIQVCMQIEHVLKKVPGMFLRLSDNIPLSLRKKLQDCGFWFDNSDRFMQSAGIYDHWPKGRSIFVSRDWHVSVWINEEDHLRLMCVVPNFDLPKAVSYLLPVLKFLEQQLSFSQTRQLGFITSCPTNLGTGCRISVHAYCSPEAVANLQSRGLVIRNQHGEHVSVSTDTYGIYDISVAERLGITESQIMKKLHQSLVDVLG
ncbi:MULTISPECIES: hypothetical protein [Moorena]|uniref:Arginine kinase n=1 Tax=Moorena producens (strain JHB) TaxID=1454205 RepID=A0A1D9G4I9_MOOP1|nr:MULTISPECIES: hypothetical protein [Moorena]AOY82503.1 hypothetical protein BJP36_23910 [Moorena producens JHB]NER90984.1 hypothetical protein [Moorena sp. SIO3A2]